MSTVDEKRGYAKGYIAGQKRSIADTLASRKQLAKLAELEYKIKSVQRERRDAFFCAALTGLLAIGIWKKGDLTGMRGQVAIAKDFADASMEAMP